MCRYHLVLGCTSQIPAGPREALQKNVYDLKKTVAGHLQLRSDYCIHLLTTITLPIYLFIESIN